MLENTMQHKDRAKLLVLRWFNLSRNKKSGQQFGTPKYWKSVVPYHLCKNLLRLQCAQIAYAKSLSMSWLQFFLLNKNSVEQIDAKCSWAFFSFEIIVTKIITKNSSILVYIVARLKQVCKRREIREGAIQRIDELGPGVLTSQVDDGPITTY